MKHGVWVFIVCYDNIFVGKMKIPYLILSQKGGDWRCRTDPLGHRNPASRSLANRSPARASPPPRSRQAI